MANKNKVALASSGIFSSWHVAWSIVAATGLGQRFYDFILWEHMIHLPVTIGPFATIASATLIIVTTAIGYVTGYFAALIWNIVHK